VSHLSLYLVLLVTLRQVGVTDAQVSWAEVLAVFAFARLATALPLTPGGLGVVEAILVGGLVGAGGATSQVAAGVLVYRALTWFPPIPLGILSYVSWLRTNAPSGERAASTFRRWSRTGSTARHPADVVRIVLASAVLAAIAHVLSSHAVSAWEEHLFRLINDIELPSWTDRCVWLLMQLGVIGAVPAIAALALATRRLRLAVDAALAGGAIYLIAKLVKASTQRGRPQTLLEDVHILGKPAHGLGYVSGHTAVAFAMAAVASPYLGRRARRVVWILAVGVGLARIYVGAHLPLDVIGGAALGWSAAALVHLLFGAPTGEPSSSAVADELTVLGFDATGLRPAGEDGQRSARYFTDSATGRSLFVKVVPRERRSADLLYRIVQWPIHAAKTRSVMPSPAVRDVDHEAAMALLAASRGVRTPAVLAVASIGNGAGLLVSERIDGRTLAELLRDCEASSHIDDPGPSERALSDLWVQVAKLHAAGIEHGELTPDNVVVDGRDEVWLVDFDRSQRTVNHERLDAEWRALSETIADECRAKTTARPRPMALLEN
jgi:membrane-associated phospholipid phosphatase/predicted Ser/Thr protein kinase